MSADLEMALAIIGGLSLVISALVLGCVAVGAVLREQRVRRQGRVLVREAEQHAWGRR